VRYINIVHGVSGVTPRTIGAGIDKILPAMSRFGGGNRQEKKKSVIKKLK
jgi:type I restriction enzyme R subunit